MHEQLLSSGSVMTSTCIHTLFPEKQNAIKYTNRSVPKIFWNEVALGDQQSAGRGHEKTENSMRNKYQTTSLKDKLKIQHIRKTLVVALINVHWMWVTLDHGTETKH